MVSQAENGLLHPAWFTSVFASMSPNLKSHCGRKHREALSQLHSPKLVSERTENWESTSSGIHIAWGNHFGRNLPISSCVPSPVFPKTWFFCTLEISIIISGCSLLIFHHLRKCKCLPPPPPRRDTSYTAICVDVYIQYIYIHIGHTFSHSLGT